MDAKAMEYPDSLPHIFMRYTISGSFASFKYWFKRLVDPSRPPASLVSLYILIEVYGMCSLTTNSLSAFVHFTIGLVSSKSVLKDFGRDQSTEPSCLHSVLIIYLSETTFLE
jgi:hypothetical protein